MRSSFWLRLFAAALATLAFAGSAAAQSAWPDRPITLVIGYAPGGQADMHARILAKGLTERLGQNVIIDYKAGAGTTIAGEYGARAKPDGYTLLLAGGSMLTIAPHTYSSVHYKIEDFQTVSLTSIIPVGLIINAEMLPTVKDFKDFLAYAKANPGKINYATTGPGGASHMLGELIKAQTGIDMVAVHYKGSGPAQQDLLAGRVHAIIDSLPPHLPYIATGKLRGLAISTEQRLPGAPMVPTFAEMGYPKLGMGSWNGIVVPRGTPPAIVNKLHDAIAEVVASEEFQHRVISDAIVPVSDTPAEFDALVRRDYQVWGDVLRHIGGIKID